MIDTSIPAFPVDPSAAEMKPAWLWTGMSLRDYFAAATLPTLRVVFLPDDDSPEKMMAMYAYRVADAMLAERSKP
jgi:hypothetical protein